MSSPIITELSSAFGISYGTMLVLFVIILAWSIAWKLMALWKSARKGSLAWFIILGVVNTVGILEILYIYVFSKIKLEKKEKKSAKSGKKKRKR